MDGLLAIGLALFVIVLLCQMTQSRKTGSNSEDGPSVYVVPENGGDDYLSELVDGYRQQLQADTRGFSQGIGD